MTGIPRDRSFAIESGLLKPLPPAMTRSAPSPTIFSMSMAPSLTTCVICFTAGG